MRVYEFNTIQKNQWTLLVSNSDKTDLASELISLVDNAYSHTNLGSFIKNLQDVENSDWLVFDWDKDPGIDCAIFYRKPRNNENWSGYKLQGIGHDGSTQSKQIVIQKVTSLLEKAGWWIESSDAMMHTLGKLGVAPVTSIDILQKLFPNTKLTLLNNSGLYKRLAGPSLIKEMVFGHPVISN